MLSIEPGQVLVVDDDAAVARLLGRILRGDGHQATFAADGQQALEQAARQPPDLILLDLDMPGLNGFEVCRCLKADPATRLTPILIMTGRPDSSTRLRAFDLDADQFLPKPFQATEVLARVRSLLRSKRLVEQLDSAEAVVFALARAMEAKSPFTHGHSERVKDHALRLAVRLGLPEQDRDVLARGALLHDVGKISIPDAILNKPGPLTPEEEALMLRHPEEGVRILERLRSVRAALPLVRWHHERPDGKGYPDGLAGDDIPLLVRVLSVADVYDALASRRPYRAALPHEECLRLLRADAATGGLDPDLVACFCEVEMAPACGACPTVAVV